MTKDQAIEWACQIAFELEMPLGKRLWASSRTLHFSEFDNGRENKRGGPNASYWFLVFEVAGREQDWLWFFDINDCGEIQLIIANRRKD